MRRLAILAFGAVLGASAPAAADSVKVVTGNDYKPFTDESLQEGGLITDLVRSAYTNAGHEVSIKFLPWRRGEKGVETGDFDATFPYVVTAERKKKYAYSDPVFVAQERPIVMAEDGGSINSLEDMKGKTLCMPIGYKTASTDLQDLIANGDVEETKPRTVASCFRMLKAGRVDFLSLERPTAMIEAQDALGGADDLSFEDYVTSETVLHLIFDKGGENTAQQVDAFNAALSKLKDSGEYQQIVDKHLK